MVRALYVIAYMAGIFLLSSMSFASIEVSALLSNLAHVTLYTGLGGLLYWALLKQEKILRVAYAFTLGTVFSVCDEVYQNFVPGRTFSTSDIDMDLLGVALGIIVVFLFLKGKDRWNKPPPKGYISGLYL